MNPVANTVLFAIGLVILGLFALLLAAVLIGLIVVIISATASSVRDDWREKHE